MLALIRLLTAVFFRSPASLAAENLALRHQLGVLQRSEPVNRFPDFVRYLVQQLSVLLPTMGKVRIAQALARAGLHLGTTTVGRMLKEDDPLPEDAAEALIEVQVVQTRVVTANRPGQVWHVDLATVPTWGRLLGPVVAARVAATLAWGARRST